MSSDDKKTVAIASGKGGVGKSFLALNLALALAELGHKVLLVELDCDAGALSIAAGLGDKQTCSGTSTAGLHDKILPLHYQPRVHLLRGCDIPAVAVRSAGTLESMLRSIDVTWRIIDLPPGIAGQTILWMRRADVPLLIGTPELVCVRAMLRLHMQLRRQHAYERLCTMEPWLRKGPASLSSAKQQLTTRFGAARTEQLWSAAHADFRPPTLILNRVLSEDTAQLARIGSYLRRHTLAWRDDLPTIPEEPAQLRCARFGRPLLMSGPETPAADAIRRIADRCVIARAGSTGVRIVSRPVERRQQVS